MSNTAKCKLCKDTIESKHRHDFVTCKCGAISVDGGSDYIRRLGDPSNFMEVEMKSETNKNAPIISKVPVKKQPLPKNINLKPIKARPRGRG